MMRRTILVAVVVGCLAAAPVPMYRADPSLEGEMALPPLSLARGLKLDDRWLIPPKYADQSGEEELRKVLRETQALLWASSPEPTPARLRADVVRLRSKYSIPTGLIKTYYLAPRTMPMTNAFKDGLLKTNRDVARVVAALENQLDAVQALAEAREKECPRWQAHYDFLAACLMFRLAHLDEYAIQIGEMRKEFPERDPAKHKGWRMEPADGLRDVPGKKRVKAARKLLERLTTEHDGTPWAAAAKQMMDLPLSAAWKAE
jgi:hypothetical protein